MLAVLQGINTPFRPGISTLLDHLTGPIGKDTLRHHGTSNTSYWLTSIQLDHDLGRCQHLRQRPDYSTMPSLNYELRWISLLSTLKVLSKKDRQGLTLFGWKYYCSQTLYEKWSAESPFEVYSSSYTKICSLGSPSMRTPEMWPPLHPGHWESPKVCTIILCTNSPLK